MLFVINIGNTNIAGGLWEQGSWIEYRRFSTDVKKTPDEYGLMLRSSFGFGSGGILGVRKTVIGSVVPELDRTFDLVIQDLFGMKPFRITSDTRAGLGVAIDNPQEMGADLLADAVAGFNRTKSSCIVVDFGTALSFTAVDAPGIIRGASIAPGIGTAIKALSSNTAKLPSVPLEPPPHALGTDTITAIQSGILFGYVGLVEHLVRKISEELTPPVSVVATGGYAEVLTGLTSCFDIVDPRITLDGLRLISEYEEAEK
jgi:type III pantothenate kinase